MNISDFNPLGGGKPAVNRNVTDRQKTESREKAAEVSAERMEVRASEPDEMNEASPLRDVFQSSEDRRKVSDLTDQVQSAGDSPRQEMVSRACERAASGYYNSSEFLGVLAGRLIDTGLAG